MARMNKQMQAFNIGRMIAGGSRYDTDVYDVKANIDSRLTLSENRQNIARQLGISSRNRGLEHIELKKAELNRTRKLRSDPLRQTGKFSNESLDRMFQAMRPGKRISASGYRYYERRENRSDRGKLL